MQLNAPAPNARARMSGLFAAAREILHARSWSALARLTVLLVLLALPITVYAADSPKPVGEAEAATAPAPTKPAPPAAPGLNEPTRTFAPTAGPEWVDRLSLARRSVLDTSEASDAANATYARALYHKMQEGAELEAIRARRTQARQEYVEAMEALPELIARAREAGVSPEVLKLYQESMPR